MAATVGRLVWDDIGERYYQNGVRRGVLYPYDSKNKAYGTGVEWNGLTSIQVTPSGGEANDQYADDIKYLSLYSVEENGATIEAFTYPKEFEECDGSRLINGTVGLKARAQTRKQFGLCWRTNVGNDIDEEVGYIIHILYGCKASPSERQFQTINESPEALTFSWEVTCLAPQFSDDITDEAGNKYKNTALFEIDSRDFDADTKAKLTALEDKLYGTSTTTEGTVTPVTDPELPLPEALIDLMKVSG